MLFFTGVVVCHTENIQRRVEKDGQRLSFH
jgi:hypothetical protein